MSSAKCTSRSHSGKPCSLDSCIWLHKPRNSWCSSLDIDGPGLDPLAASKRSAKTYVWRVTTASSSASPRIFSIMPRTAPTLEIALTLRYLSTPQRAIASRISSKSHKIDSAEPSAAVCELAKAALACGAESRHTCTVPTEGSPTTSDPCSTRVEPSTLSSCSRVTH